jgi:hypothetical protein
MRSSLAAVLLVLAAACVHTPDDPLVWSDNVVRELPLENGETVPAGPFSSLLPGGALKPWEQYYVRRGNLPTEYRIVDVDGERVLEADAQEGGTGLFRRIRIDPRRHPVLEFRWRVPRDSLERLKQTSGGSPLARLSLGFHGDVDKLDFDDRAKLRLATVLTANGLPYASLLYVWMLDEPVGTVFHSPYTGRVRYLVVESGTQRLGEWVQFRRDIVEDYRRAFGEDPGEVVGVGVMTDPGDDYSRRRGFYGDIIFRSGK